MNRTATILIVDDDTTVINALRKILAGVGELTFATSGAEALRIARESLPDLILLDVEMPGTSGLQVCMSIKDDPLLQNVPVIFITSHHGTEQEVAGLAAGAVDFIGKPPSAPVVVARVKTHLRMKQMADALRQVAMSDGLTGLANRRRFDEVLKLEAARAARNRTPLALALLDVDHFKKYNDHFGHQAGDQCLIAVAQAIKHCACRPADLAARYGGEEFVLLLPETDALGASNVALRVIAAVDGLALPHAEGLGYVTVSAGVSVYQCTSDNEDSRTLKILQGMPDPVTTALIGAADKALYDAKHHGRHQAWLLPMTQSDTSHSSYRIAQEPTPTAAGQTSG